MIIERRSYHLGAILSIFTIIGISAKPQITTCRTFNGEIGNCIPILTCKTITQLLENSQQPLPPAVIQTVRRSHCGTFENIHHVCCKKNREELEPTRSTIQIHASTPKSQLDVQLGMLVLGVFTCGKIQTTNRKIIGNGSTAQASEFPWMALLVYEDGSQRTMECGGSLISDQYVITAAHCIRVPNKNLVSVRLGVHDLDERIDCADEGRTQGCAPNVQEIDIAEAIYHKDFSISQFSNDIGLIRLNAKAVFSNSVQPICLPTTPQSQAATFSRMIIAGWGRIENGMRANLLQTAEVPVRDNDYCQQIHRLIRITDQQICAGSENNVDTCTGDSGGPLFAFASNRDEGRYIQYGIVSAGASVCGSRFPGIYVKISAYLPWIAGNIRP